MGDALMDAVFWINPPSIWVTAPVLAVFYAIARRRIDASKRGLSIFVSYVGVGGVLGLVLGALILGLALGFPGGLVLLMIVFWPLAFSIGALLGAALWWRDTVKPNRTVEADARNSSARGSP
jgi:hypothetical protein